MKKKREVYRARKVCPAVKLSDEQAQTIALELSALNGSNGNFREIPTKTIVERARDPSSAMHPIIWGRDDMELAYEARLTLARQVVNSIRIVFVDEGEEHTKPIVVNVRIAPGELRGYVPTDRVVTDDYMSEQIAKRAISRLRGWLEEFRAFRHGAIGPLWDAVKEAVQDADPRSEDTSQRPAPHRPVPHRAPARRNAKSSTAPSTHPGELG